ncbi:hypothetical protein FB451DRAFT_1186767 [Mycena latifolia]|nr:hypothetical protein FB451DRAFT_1186767 [Mycena latifolia]
MLLQLLFLLSFPSFSLPARTKSSSTMVAPNSNNRKLELTFLAEKYGALTQPQVPFLGAGGSGRRIPYPSDHELFQAQAYFWGRAPPMIDPACLSLFVPRQNEILDVPSCFAIHRHFMDTCCAKEMFIIPLNIRLSQNIPHFSRNAIPMLKLPSTRYKNIVVVQQHMRRKLNGILAKTNYESSGYKGINLNKFRSLLR